MNALIEYKNAIKAPGAGEFGQGKPLMFKM
jgi:hypothetical protein